LQKVSPGTIRQRRKRGWTDDEIIEGEQARTTAYKRPASPPRPAGTRLPRTKAHHQSPVREQLLNEAERRFRQNAKLAEQHRREHGEELCFAPLSMINELIEECPVPLSPVPQEAYDRRFELWWADWWPHVFFDKLPEEAQQTLSRIERRNGMPLPGRSSETEEKADVAAQYRRFVAASWKPIDRQTYYLRTAPTSIRPQDAVVPTSPVQSRSIQTAAATCRETRLQTGCEGELTPTN
jgi:hypothetical protein